MITDLRADEIEVREDGISQKVVSFEGGRIYPRVSNIEVHLLFDCSGSIQTPGLLNPRVFSANLLDEFQHARIAIWGFSGPKSPKYFTVPTRDLARLNRALEKVRGMKNGSTPLYRSLLQVARRLSKPSSDSVRMIVVVSDGLSNVGPSIADGAIRAAQRAGAALFPVLVNAQASNSSSRPPEVAERVLAFQKVFTSMAEPTGGRSFEFPGEAPGDLLNQILNRISSVIRRDYIAGYSPALVGGHNPHKVQVFLKDNNRGRIVGGVRYVQH